MNAANLLCAFAVALSLFGTTSAIVSISPIALYRKLAESPAASRRLLTSLNRLGAHARQRGGTALNLWKGKVTWPMPRLVVEPIIEPDPGFKPVLDLMLWNFFCGTLSTDRFNLARYFSYHCYVHTNLAIDATAFQTSCELGIGRRFQCSGCIPQLSNRTCCSSQRTSAAAARVCVYIFPVHRACAYVFHVHRAYILHVHRANIHFLCSSRPVHRSDARHPLQYLLTDFVEWIE